MKTKCVLSTSPAFNWGKKTDVVKLAGKHTQGWMKFNGRSDAIVSIIEAMTPEQISSQFALFFEEGGGESSATLKTMLFEVLRVGAHSSGATNKYTVWNRKFDVVLSLYGGIIQTIGTSFHKTGSNSFAKWVGVVIDGSNDANYLKKSKDIQKWVMNNHFQMLKKVDLDFLLRAAMALLAVTGMKTAQDNVRKVIDIFQMIIAANATVAVYDDDKMLWVLKNGPYGSIVGDIGMTDAIGDRVGDGRKRIVTPSKDEKPMKVMKVGDEPKLSRSLFSDSDIGDETGELLNTSRMEDDTSVLDKPLKTLEDQTVEKVHLNGGFATMEGKSSKNDDELMEDFPLPVLTEEEKERIKANADYAKYLILKEKLFGGQDIEKFEFKASPANASGKLKNHIDQYEFENMN
jgi:hypothetical protein